MAIKLQEFNGVWTRVKRVLRPSTKLGRAPLWSGAASLLLHGLCSISRSPSGSALRDWTTLFTLVFLCSVLLLGLRWFWRVLLWRLRNRLIVTYIFIGVIPVVLLLLMGLLGEYLFAGQFATYVAISDLQSQLQHLTAANNALAAQLSALDRVGRFTEKNAADLTIASGENFPQQTVTVWRGARGFILTPDGTLLETRPAPVPDVIVSQGNFSNFVLDDDGLQLRAVTRSNKSGTKANELIVVSNVPITPELLQPVASRLGAITLHPLLGYATQPPNQQDEIEIITQENAEADPRNKRVSAGSVAPSTSLLNPALRSYTLFDVVDWKTGKAHFAGIDVTTRPLSLYQILFATLGNKAKYLLYALFGITFFFGLIELIALTIGVRLSRSITLAVAQLYRATQHVNRGDFTHRIPVRSRDQMAELGRSFNSMTESLSKLMVEQKEKQRLESELAIAFEVQNTLFPQPVTGFPSLEVFGTCRPARSVSGDYYDFIPLGDDRLVLAVGDISGKGISAALLMATVHAFVRAYSLEPARILTPVAVSTMAGAIPQISQNEAEDDPRMYYRGDGITQAHLAPGTLMTTLNYQLFRSTPPEKYATMFLGCYDVATGELKYCNAGHLPPILLQHNGEACHLETSGTVVGLFDGISYEESAIALQAGDIFIAFSDGVTEPENASGEFGEQRLIDLIRQHREQPLARIAEIVTDSVTEWIGNAEQPDDITVVLARAR